MNDRQTSASTLGIGLGILAMVLVVTVSNVAVQYPINDWLTCGALTYPIDGNGRYGESDYGIYVGRIHVKNDLTNRCGIGTGTIIGHIELKTVSEHVKTVNTMREQAVAISRPDSEWPRGMQEVLIETDIAPELE